MTVEQILKKYSKYLEEYGYTDADWREEKPTAIKRFADENKSIPLDAEVKVQAAEWTKEKPNKPCVFMTRVWNNHLKIFDYNIWRLIKTDSTEDDTWYLGWYTEGGEEWDDYSDCNFDEYKIIGEI